LSEAAL